MSGLATRSAVGATLLFAISACAGGPRTVDVPEDDARPSADVASSPRTPAASPTATATPDDVRLMRAFVEFALNPSAEKAAQLPLADQVRLGLGPDLRATLDQDDADQASAWVLDAEHFRAYTGPFSALELIQRQGRAWEVSVGPHPHCASPPMPAPQGYAQHRRISVQPSPDSIDSCLTWFSVDVFLDPEGRIAAVTLDVWEPQAPDRRTWPRVSPAGQRPWRGRRPCRDRAPPR